MQIDLVSPSSFSLGHPHHQYDWLRENAPVYWHPSPVGGGFWVLSRYKDVYETGRNHQVFSSSPTIMMDDPLAGASDAFGEYKMMLMMDPPQHTQFRKLIRNEFTTQSADGMRARISELAHQIVDAVIERGECDFVSDIAGEMPSFVIAEMMGLPLEDGRKLYHLTEVIHSAPETLPEGAQTQAVLDMFTYGAKVFEEKSARPGRDLASKIIASEVDGRKLNMVEFQLFFLLLIDAGGDTTRNLVSAGMLALMENPGQQAWLMDDLDARLPQAREELLRWVSPVVYMRRTLKQDTVIEGQAMAAGDRVIMYYASANRDPRHFERADHLDLSRTGNDHLAFGGGGHVCLGQHIARIEIDALLREVLLRMKGLACRTPPKWLASNFISGPQAMPVRFDEAARVKA